MHLAAIGRFPVKSMGGEAPTTAELGPAGIVGDRAYAVVDRATGKVASAKRPAHWAVLMGLRATTAADGAVHITLPDGSTVAAGDPAAATRLGKALGREVELAAEPAAGQVYEDEWPDVEGMAPEEFVASTRVATSEAGLAVSDLAVGMFAPGTFQDVAPVTIMTTASLAAAAALHPDGDWDVRRFRPNLLIDTGDAGFVEDGWAGRRLQVGETVIEVLAATPRCVMPTLAVDELPADRRVLQVLAKGHRVDGWASLGAYATVVTPGPLRVGDDVTLV